MLKKKINYKHYDLGSRWSGDTGVNVNIDNEKYVCEVLNDQKRLILRRIIDGNRWNSKSIPIQVFDLDNITYIDQIDIGKFTYFITCEHRKDYSHKVTIYNDLTKWYGPFKQEAKFNNVCDYKMIDDMTLYFETPDEYKFLYNIAYEKRSHTYGKDAIIWYSKKLMDYLDPRYHSTILIREKVAKGSAKDTITYGLDIKQMDLATRVRSQEQDRYIKKYNLRETTKYKRQNGQFIGNDIRKKCGETTMQAEINKYLDLLDESGEYKETPSYQFEPGPYIYKEEGEYPLNTEYLKKLKRRYYVGKQKKSNIN